MKSFTFILLTLTLCLHTEVQATAASDTDSPLLVVEMSMRAQTGIQVMQQRPEEGESPYMTHNFHPKPSDIAAFLGNCATALVSLKSVSTEPRFRDVTWVTEWLSSMDLPSDVVPECDMIMIPSFFQRGVVAPDPIVVPEPRLRWYATIAYLLNKYSKTSESMATLTCSFEPQSTDAGLWLDVEFDFRKADGTIRQCKDEEDRELLQTLTSDIKRALLALITTDTEEHGAAGAAAAASAASH